MAEEPPAGRSFQIIPLICASLTDALGLLTFFGWVSGLPLLASVRAKYIPRPRAPLFAFPSLWAAPKALAKSPIPQIFRRRRLRGGNGSAAYGLRWPSGGARRLFLSS